MTSVLFLKVQEGLFKKVRFGQRHGRGEGFIESSEGKELQESNSQCPKQE